MSENPWIIRSKQLPEASARLFCLPHAGGSAAMFYAWPPLLPDTVEMVAIQLPGRGGRLREAPFTRMGLLVDALAKAITPYLDRPYAIFGHSLGALQGFELARTFADRGNPPRHLFVSACSAPHLHAPEPRLHDLPDAEFIAALGRLDGIPQEILEHEELMAQLMPIFRADFAISETYEYRDGLVPCPITAFGGRADRLVPAENLAGWRQHTEALFDLVFFPGGHFYLPEAAGKLLQQVVLKLGPG